MTTAAQHREGWEDLTWGADKVPAGEKPNNDDDKLGTSSSMQRHLEQVEDIKVTNATEQNALERAKWKEGSAPATPFRVEEKQQKKKYTS